LLSIRVIKSVKAEHSNFSKFFEFYLRKFNFFPLWIVPYKLRKYPWINEDYLKNISDELFRLKRKYDLLVKEIESTSEEITEKLDHFLDQHSDLLK